MTTERKIGLDRPVNRGNAGKGRKKGVPNKITADLRAMILGALDSAGGQDYLVQQARDTPGAFMTLLGKVLPTTLAGDAENPLLLMSESESDARLAELMTKAGWRQA